MPAQLQPRAPIQIDRPVAIVSRSHMRRGSSTVGVAMFATYAPQAAAYLDYSRRLTPEGGVLLTYKDIDERWRWWVWRLFAWSLATGIDYELAFHLSPLRSGWLNVLCWLVAAFLNFLIVRHAIAVKRRIEIRPDCLILEGREVFWRRMMEGGLPELKPQDEETFSLVGVYGTRLVDYGTLRRFDDNDRQPETFNAHFKMATEQLWSQ